MARKNDTITIADANVRIAKAVKETGDTYKGMLEIKDERIDSLTNDLETERAQHAEAIEETVQAHAEHVTELENKISEILNATALLLGVKDDYPGDIFHSGAMDFLDDLLEAGEELKLQAEAKSRKATITKLQRKIKR